MKIIGNILGDMSGQLGKKIVAFSWKGIDVFRSYVVPANPRTVGQVAQRNKFTAVLEVAQGIITSVIHPYWKAFAIHMSNFNAWMKANLDSQSFPLVLADFILTKGSLAPVVMSDCVYVTGDGSVEATYSNELGSNGLGTDIVELYLYDQDSNAFLLAGTGTRTAGSISGSVVTGLTLLKMRAYIFAYRALGTVDEIISDSTNLACTDS
jgi:hypothetical protein